MLTTDQLDELDRLEKAAVPRDCTGAWFELAVATRKALPELLAMARQLLSLKEEQRLQLIEMRDMGPKAVAQEMVVGLLAAVKFVLDGYDAPNYVETKVMDSSGQMYAVTFQRCGKESPHDLRQKAEQQLLRAREAALPVRVYLAADADVPRDHLCELLDAVDGKVER
jgi:hypothetical protein